MVVDTRRPPLPAPTEDPSSMDNESNLGTDLATEVSRRTDKTSISIPEDGSPITLTTARLAPGKDTRLHHGRQKSQTSLLIEYFEAGRSGDKVRSKPSVRVKVTPSAARKTRNGSDAVQITGIGRDRKPSYTRRISLGNRVDRGDNVIHIEGTEISRSSDSNVSARPPIEVEVLNANGSDLSNSRNSRDLRYMENTSDVSSMPPDSLLDTAAATTTTGTAAATMGTLHRTRSRSLERETINTTTDHLEAPSRTRSRSLSRERITQKVMEKLAARPVESGSRRHRVREGVEYEPDTKPSKEKRRRSSRTQTTEELQSPDSSLLSSNVPLSQASYRSGNSKVSLNNPRLLEMVEDTVRRLILPQIEQIKGDQKTSSNLREFDDSRRTSAIDRDSYEDEISRSLSKSSSTPNIRSKPKVVLNREKDHPGEVLSRGDSERRKTHRSVRGSDPSRRRDSKDSIIEEESYPVHEGKDGHVIRNTAAGALAGGILTAAALKHHDSHGEVSREKRKKRTKSRSSRSRSESYSEAIEGRHPSQNTPLGTEETSDLTDTRRSHPPHSGVLADVTNGRIHANHLPYRSDETSEFTEERLHGGHNSLHSDGYSDVHGKNVYHEHIPPMPFAAGPTDSELTRDSILSASTARPYSDDFRDVETPIQEVTRGEYGDIRSSSTVTPNRTPITARNVGSRQSNRSFNEVLAQSPKSNQSISSKARLAALATIGLGGAVAGHHLGNKHSELSERHGAFSDPQGVSPVQSVSSLREDLRDPLIPEALRPRSQASVSGADWDKTRSFVPSPLSSPGMRQNAEHRSPLVPDSSSFAAHSAKRNSRPNSDLTYEASTPRGEDMEEWFQQQHEENERYRDSLTGSSLHDTSVDGKRLTGYTENSFGDSTMDQLASEQNLRQVGVHEKPQYVGTPLGIESNVASLLDPSMISSIQSSGTMSDRMTDTAHSGRMAENVRELSRPSPAPHELEVAEELESASPTKNHWSEVRQRAQALSDHASSKEGIVTQSPRQSVTDSLRDERSTRGHTPVQMGTSAVPIASEQMPEIGHGFGTEESDLTTDPSDIQGPVSAKESRERFSEDSVSPRKNHRDFSFQKDDDASLNSEHSYVHGHGHDHGHVHAGEIAGLGIATGAAGALAAKRVYGQSERSGSSHSVSHRARVEDEYEEDREETPDLRQAKTKHMRESATPDAQIALGDEGYASGAYARSSGVESPLIDDRNDNQITPQALAEYEAAMGADEEDPFVNTEVRRQRHLSANSHGMESPLYDSSTGKGLDRIHSKDVVALMDHLTVRDAQRNARDTEILVTLVRSAAEMRTSFEEMKKFIADQDRTIMKNTDRNADLTVHKVLGGPRPQPQSGSRTPRTSLDEEDDNPARRKNVFKRALKGLSMKSSNDLAKIEEMLMQLLDDMEVLKDGQAEMLDQKIESFREEPDRRSNRSTTDSLDSYERMRAAPDSGYESGRPGSASTANHSQQLPFSPPPKQGFHSGYDGRRDSITRVSTVLEGDEDEDEPLEPHERALLSREFQDDSRYANVADARRHGVPFSGNTGTPPHRQTAFNDKSVEATPEKQRKHKSASSSLMAGVPKVSRWSKTTASSAPDGYDSRRQSQEQRPLSEASRSADSLAKSGAFYDDDYSLQSDDRLRSTQSLAREQDATPREMDTRSLRSARSQVTRTPSPLIPDATSSIHRRSIDEPLAKNSPKLVLPVDEADYDIDDPKYQAHRNSLLLQHPQPRQGSTHRHQSNLESQAQDFRHEMGTDSDLSQRTVDSDFDPLQWGSNPALSLARTNKLGGIGANNSPLASPTAGNFPSPRRQKDNGPLMPSQQRQAPAPAAEPVRNTAPPQPSFDKMYYSSPLGSGHLLEPIPEVRYSLETDRDVHRTPSVTPEPEPRVDRSRLSTGRKITGPRTMPGSRSSSGTKGSPGNEIKRKPIGRSRESIESETF